MGDWQGNWKMGQGWEGSKIGFFYGGATIQGLLAYFYHVVAPEAGVALDRLDFSGKGRVEARNISRREPLWLFS